MFVCWFLLFLERLGRFYWDFKGKKADEVKSNLSYLYFRPGSPRDVTLTVLDIKVNRCRGVWTHNNQDSRYRSDDRFNHYSISLWSDVGLPESSYTFSFKPCSISYSDILLSQRTFSVLAQYRLQGLRSS